MNASSENIDNTIVKNKMKLENDVNVFAYTLENTMKKPKVENNKRKHKNALRTTSDKYDMPSENPRINFFTKI